MRNTRFIPGVNALELRLPLNGEWAPGEDLAYSPTNPVTDMNFVIPADGELYNPATLDLPPPSEDHLRIMDEIRREAERMTLEQERSAQPPGEDQSSWYQSILDALDNIFSDAAGGEYPVLQLTP